MIVSPDLLTQMQAPVSWRAIETLADALVRGSEIDGATASGIISSAMPDRVAARRQTGGRR